MPVRNLVRVQKFKEQIHKLETEGKTIDKIKSLRLNSELETYASREQKEGKVFKLFKSKYANKMFCHR